MSLNNDLTKGTRINDAMLQTLRQTRTWVKIVAICGFISVAFLVIVGLTSTLASSHSSSNHETFAITMTGVINLVLSFVYLIPSVYLYKYSSSIDRFLAGGSSEDLEKALRCQKSFWKFIGILVIISFVGILAAIIIPQIAVFSGKVH